MFTDNTTALLYIEKRGGGGGTFFTALNREEQLLLRRVGADAGSSVHHGDQERGCGFSELVVSQFWALNGLWLRT